MNSKFLSPIAISLYIFLLFTIIIGGISYIRYGYTQDFIENIFVEAHGMLFDILVVGILIYWLNSFGEKNREIKRFLEEIDDFRNWKSEESKHRTHGIIKRLINLNYSGIDLSNCDLSALKLKGNLQKTIFYKTNLNQTDLSQSILTKSNFNNCQLNKSVLPSELREIEFHKINFSKMEFRNYDFSKCLFKNCNLNQTKFIDCNFTKTIISDSSFSNVILAGCNLNGSKLYVNGNVDKDNIIKNSDLEPLKIYNLSLFQVYNFLDNIREINANYSISLDYDHRFTGSHLKFKKR